LYDEAGAKQAAAILEKAKANNVKIVFPVDYITAEKFDKDAKVRSLSPLLSFSSPLPTAKLVKLTTLFSFSMIAPDRSRYRRYWNPRRMDGSRRRTRVSKALRRYRR